MANGSREPRRPRRLTSFAQVRAYERADGDDAQMFGVGSFEREFDECVAEMTPAQFLRNLGMNQLQRLWRSLVDEERRKPVSGQLETTGGRVVDDRHASYCG